mgnify:CR=1 FL=1
MSYAIVRNEKLTRAEVNGKCTHNDRKAKCHTNKDIDPTKTHLNYYIKKKNYTYTKEFDKLRKEQNLADHLRENSIIMCQMIFTSDQEFFDRLGEHETKRYFDYHAFFAYFAMLLNLFIFHSSLLNNLLFSFDVNWLEILG